MEKKNLGKDSNGRCVVLLMREGMCSLLRLHPVTNAGLCPGMTDVFVAPTFDEERVRELMRRGEQLERDDFCDALGVTRHVRVRLHFTDVARSLQSPERFRHNQDGLRDAWDMFNVDDYTPDMSRRAWGKVRENGRIEL